MWNRLNGILDFCYLHTGQNLEARAHFKEIANSDGSFNKEARKIMRSIVSYRQYLDFIRLGLSTE